MTVDASEAVKVVVRCRPMNERELTNGYEKCVNVDVGSQSILLKNPKQRSNEDPRVFTFDCVYDENSTQRELYEKTFQNLVQSVLDGFNGTIFAYGQTGTGKTFTIQGVENDPELQGVMPNSFAQIFRHIAESKGSQYLVRASYLEIYKEEVRDLLQRDQSKNLEIKERPDSGIYVKTEADGQNHIRVGKLNLVDLAGSERQSKTLSEGERLKEATKINLSLSTLGNVISALVDGKSTHIPYRDSKLTRLLQDSLGGNAKTVMVANIGPATYNYEETLNTLRYAYRAKSIKNKPRINEDPKDALIREYQNEIERLKALLRSRSENIPRTISKTEKSKKSKRRNGADNSRDIESEAASLESYMKEQQAKLDAEKMAIMNDHSLVSEEKDRLLSELQSKEQKLQEERAQTTDLENKLKEMEGKLLVGGQSIIEHTRMQEFTLAQQRSKMAEHQRREQEIVAKMEETEGNMMNLQEGFSSLKQEVESNTRKLKKLYSKLQEVKQETMDLYERNNTERQEHEQMLEDLTREVKLRLLILENFVPVEERCNYEKRCYLDEEMEQWHVRPLVPSVEETGDTNGIIVPDDHLDPSLRSDLNSRHLKDSLFYGISESDVTTPRHDERLLVLDLDLPNRTTRDYEPPQLAPQVVAALEAALQDEEDLELDGSPSVFKSIPVKSRRKSKKLKIPMQKSDAEIFPMSRGLVPK